MRSCYARIATKYLTITALAASLAAGEALAQASPRFRPDGFDAKFYGLERGYPMCQGAAYFEDHGCRVAAFSNFAKLFPSRAIRAGATVSPLKRAANELKIEYSFGGPRTLDGYLDANPVTGFLIAQDNRILFERYQYGRTDKQQMTSFSMAKSIVGLLVGLALEEGAIRSIDDPVDAYVPELKDTEYGRTSIKALLMMASGVAFAEVYGNLSSDIYVLSRMTVQQGDAAGGIAAAQRFNTRRAPAGHMFSYSSLDSEVLGLVVARATRRTVADYASDKLWQPLGAEADAAWNIDRTGQEVTYAFYNAVLRDWARLGLMLAHGGKWNGRQVMPADWVKQATSPNRAAPTYGYQFWLSPDDRTLFQFSGRYGQFVLVDPVSKTVLVQTSLGNSDGAYMELMDIWNAARAAAPTAR